VNPKDYLALPLEAKRAVAAALLARRGEAIAARERQGRGTHPDRTPAPGRRPEGDSGTPLEGGVAIIGMSGRFPGSPDLDTFWRNLAEGRDLITPARPERWQGGEVPAGAAHGGFIEGFDAFDAAFFGIAEVEAASMDPHQRLFLETVWSALEDAGYPPGGTGSPSVGLFVGMYSPDFNQLLGPGASAREGMRLTGRLNVMVANRVSHMLDLRGPSELVDTACSSSLVAIHRAIQAIACGDCEMAIAGGISLLLSPASTQWLGEANLLSKSGRFRPFDRRGDGLVRGEGTGAVVLKPLARAIADGDTIHAVVRSSAVNHSGRSGGAVTTPNADAQAEVIINAYKRGHVRPESIDYIEAHGAASDLGDFVEVGAFRQAFAQLAPNLARESCGIGTVKANIGALDAAGAIAGVIKVVLAMRHGLWPATINYGESRSDLGLEEGPFYIVGEAERWVGRDAASARRRAAVHAYGLGGVNAHVVLEEPGSPVAETRHADPSDGELPGTHQLLFPFSARDPDRLRDVIIRFRDWLDRDGDSLADAAFTLLRGRFALEERVAIVAAGRGELRERLSSYLEGRACDGLWTGRAQTAEDGAAQPPVADSLPRAAEAWVSGGAFPADSLLLPARGRRIPLPTYPFLRRRFRLAAAGGRSDPPASGATELVDVGAAVEGLRPLPGPSVEHGGRFAASAAAGGQDGELVSRVSRYLVGSLSELLRVDAARIPVDGPITELGVDSTVFTQLVLRLNRGLGLKLTPALLFAHRTVHAFAVFLARDHADKLGSLEVPANAEPGAAARPGGSEGPGSLSLGQQALWFISQLVPDNYAYNVPVVLPLSAPVDGAAVQLALNGLAERHGALRTVFISGPGEPLQQALARFEVPLEKVSLGACSRADALTAMQAANRVPFTLGNVPPWRACLFGRKGDASLLLLTIHHLVIDGASAAILIEEFYALYNAARTGGDFSLPLPGSRFEEFVAWQKRLLAGDEGRRMGEYWIREMAGVLPVLDLSMGRSRPATQTYRGEKVLFEIDEGCARALREVARSEDATLYMVLLSAFLVLLHRYSGQDDIIIGTPMMGRNAPGFGRTIGYFINVVAIRGNLSGNPVFREFLRAIRGKAYGALENQDYPMPLLVQRLKQPRDPSRSPLFQVAFNLETWARRKDDADQGPGGTGVPVLEPFEWLHQEGEFDIQLDIFDLDRPLKSAFRYNPDVFEAATIERMAEHFRRLVREIASDPARPVGLLPFLGGGEREQLLVHWNNTHRSFPRDACLHNLIADQSARAPERVAVVCGKVSLTYGELNARADRWALALKRLGIGSGGRVGICLDRTEAMVVSVLAVMKAGAAYIPLDPAFPPERLEFMAADAELSWIITQEKRAGWRAFDGRKCLCVDAVGGELSSRGESGVNGANGHSPHAPADPERFDPESTVYILYTSGSTGKPKGVEVTHRALVNFLWSMADEPGISRDDALLAVTTLSFDIAALELYLPLVRGARVVIASHDDAVDGRRLLNLLRTSGANVMQATPATWTMLLKAGWDSTLPLKVLCGGEALSRSLADQLLAVGSEVWNLFGPTETTVWSTVARVTAGTEAVTIGRPIANTQVYVLDAQLQPVPSGVAGDLYIGGEGVARGYWRRPELTAEKFVSNPFGRSASDRMYRTGDVARWRRNGTIDFLGRGDTQVKIRGFRIELGEVENALERHPAVAQAAVTAREDKPGDRHLVAYWIRKGDRVPSVGEFRASLQETLPDYMIPSVFVPMERFPLTPNGKLDRKQLPEPERQRPSDAAYEAPRSAIEKTLGAIWAEAMGLERVGIRDNFFELGGHSLLAAEVVRRTRLVHEIELLDIFTYPTVQALAGYIQGRGNAGARPHADVAEPERLTEDNRGRGVAIVGMAGRFPGALDVEKFWENLRNGVESISRFTDDELRAAGIEPQLLSNPNYVRAGGVLEGADLFDAEFFGYSHTHARTMDPQQRVLLEGAWEALDDAGCNPESLGRRIGVFACTGANTYYQPDVRKITETVSAAAASLAFTSNEKDFAATRISYKLDLTGPSFTVQTACSSSMVAIHLACQSLESGECEAALAGGVSVLFPQLTGYLHQKDMALSPDGHCRAFDAEAQGTVFTNGLALVVLKPLARAIADRDQIYAVIKGTAIGNDGSSKVDFMAPSVQGQSEVIARAIERAGIGAQTIGMVEAHGTGTSVGDPIEFRALSDVFRNSGARTGSCAIGSLKTNVGHLNTASGAASMLKAALCLRDRTFVPSLHFRNPNPSIDLASSPFYVSTRLAEWPAGSHPRRAIIGSLGFGGTNAHAVLEEPPAVHRGRDVRTHRLVPLSAKTPAALRAMMGRLSGHLDSHQGLAFADVALTLQAGRRELDWRHFIVSRGGSDLAVQLRAEGVAGALAPTDSSVPALAFVFSGEVEPGFGGDLYRCEPAFRRAIDRGFAALGPGMDADPRRLLFPTDSERAESRRRWADPALALPLTVLFELAVFELWTSMGIKPDCVIGHGWGDFAAGVAAGVLKSEELLPLLVLAARGQAGPGAAWDACEFRPPGIRLCSSTSGGEIDGAVACDPSYWASITRNSPRWAEALSAARANGLGLFLDMGGGTAAGAALRGESGAELLESIAGDADRKAGGERLLLSLGRLWQLGRKVNWTALSDGETPTKVSLPSYPFDRKRFWLDGREQPQAAKAGSNGSRGPIIPAAAGGATADDLQPPTKAGRETPRTAGLEPVLLNGGTPHYVKRLSSDDFYFRDHVIAGKMILPGAAMLELVRAAAAMAFPARRLSAFREVVWIRPIAETSSGPEVHVHLTPNAQGAAYELRSTESGSERIHARGKLGFEPLPETAETLAIGEIQGRCPLSREGADTYTFARDFGMTFGPSMRSLERLVFNEREVLARLRAPDGAWAESASYELNPSLMDAFLTTTMMLVKDRAIADKTPYLPYAIRELIVRGPLPRECWVHAAEVDGDRADKSKETRTFRIRVADLEGRVVADFRDYSVKFFRQGKFAGAVESGGNGRTPANPVADEPVNRLAAPGSGPLTEPALPRGAIRARLQREVAGLLGVPADSLDPSRDMGEYGMDSVLVIDFISAVNAAFGLSLSPAIYFEHKSLDEFTEFLITQNPTLVRSAGGIPAATSGAAHDDPVPPTKAGSETPRKAGIEPVLLAGGISHFIKRFSADDFYFRDHVIAGKMIVPGAVMLELVRAAGAMAFPELRLTAFREVVWIRPIAGTSSGPVVHVHLTPNAQGAAYELRSNESGHGRIYAKGKLGFEPLSEPAETLAIGEIQRRCPRSYEGADTYAFARDFGMTIFGPTMRAVESLVCNEGEVLARLRVPDAAWAESASYELNPSLMDAFLSTIMILVKDRAIADKTTYLPYAVRELIVRGPLPRECWVHTAEVEGDPAKKSAETRTFRIRVADLEGKVVADFRDYSVKFYRQEKFAGATESGGNGTTRANPGDDEPVNRLAAPGSVPLTAPALSRDAIRARLQREVAGLLGVPADSLDPGRDMGEYGMDSVLVIDFISAVNAAFGLSLSPAIYFEHKSLDEFTQFLTTQNPTLVRSAVGEALPMLAPRAGGNGLSGGDARAEARAQAPVSEGVGEDSDALAVVGMAGVFPQSPDLPTFWSHLAAGRNLITEIPADRWDWREFYGDPLTDGKKTNIKWGGFISDFDKFDPRFFNLSPRDAEYMDPQQRIFLETVWRTIEDAGYAPSKLSGSRTGLYVGASGVDYQEVVLKNMGEIDIRMGAGFSLDMLPNRISYLLNLQGPSESASTTCSSSLVALHRAVDAIRNGDCEQAIVGGVSLLLVPTAYIYFSKAGILSPDGICKAFDHRANGYVRGEGAGAVLIKKLGQALADGDHVYGIIRGTAVNHGGRTRTLGSPSPLAQALVVREAFERAGASPSTVNYIEAHGTGTALGDPAEINGLKKAFSELSAARGESMAAGSCGVGSVKTNIGHLEAASGIAGMIKVLLALRHRQIPASLNLEKMNPFIQISDSPFYFVTRTTEWAALRDATGKPLPRRAGISSFGLSGVNSHVVVEEYRQPRASEARGGPELLVLSARALPNLREAARSLCDWIERTTEVADEPDYAPLADIAFTLQVGRDVMAERLAIVADSHVEAAGALRLWLEGKPSDRVFHGNVPQRRDPASNPLSDASAKQRAEESFREGRLGDLARLWISGGVFSWESVRGSSRRGRVPLPTYPFARERYWLDPQPGSISWASKPPSDPIEDILRQVRSNALASEDAAALLELLAAPEAETVEEKPVDS
jgi:amino acid adenylation domain-containing protein